MRNYSIPFTVFSPLALSALLALTACQDKPAPSAPALLPAPVSQQDQQALEQASRQVWQAGQVRADALQAELTALRQAINALLQQPDQDSLEAARNQWHKAHLAAQALSLYFALAQAHPGLLVELERGYELLEGWPIQPGFLDYFDIYAHSGLVNDIAIPVTASALREAHQQFDDADRALGLHPMAYLLWGENGQRPDSDYAAQQADAQGEDALKPQDLPNNRRRALLKLMSELALDDAGRLAGQWQPQALSSLVFFQLNSAQRSELLRAAAVQLINKQLIEQQLQRQLDPQIIDTAHLRFAGGLRDSLLVQLESLAILSEQPALLNQWTQPKLWHDQLEACIRSLRKLPEQGASETQWLTVRAALAQLALLLSPGTDASLSQS